MLNILLNGSIPLELIQTPKKKVIAYHMLNNTNLLKLVKLQNKDALICTFTKSGGDKYLWEGPTTAASYCVKLEGTSLYEFHGDLWTDRIEDKRVINLVNFNNAIKEDISVLINAIRQEVFSIVKDSIPMSKWSYVQKELLDTTKHIDFKGLYIKGDLDKVMVAIKNILAKVDFNSIVKSLTVLGNTKYNEVILTNFKILKVYKTNTIELDDPYNVYFTMTYKQFCKI